MIAYLLAIAVPVAVVLLLGATFLSTSGGSNA